MLPQASEMAEVEVSGMVKIWEFNWGRRLFHAACTSVAWGKDKEIDMGEVTSGFLTMSQRRTLHLPARKLVLGLVFHDCREPVYMSQSHPPAGGECFKRLARREFLSSCMLRKSVWAGTDRGHA